MAYFNYFIKQLIRIFTRKFFWLILILVCLFLGFIIFNNNGVFAVSNLTFNESYITSSDISSARSKVGETIWNDDTYDIFIHYNAGTGSKCVTYFQPSLEYSTVNYTLIQGTGNVNNYRTSALKLVANGSIASRSQVICKSLSNNWSETLASASSDSSVNCYWFYSTLSDLSSVLCKPIRTHYNILDSDGNIIFVATNPVFFNPYILNSNEISNWSFDTLNISLGSVSFDNSNSYYLSYNFNGVDYGIELRDFYNESLGYFVVPRNQLTNNIVVRNDDIFNFTLIYRSLTSVIPYELGSYTIAITDEEQEQINQDSEKALQGQILSEQQKTNDKLDQTNNKLDNLDNTINNDNIDDVSGDFSGFSDGLTVQDNSGIDSIFQRLYDAFCTDSVQNVVITIPFVNKTFTIDTTSVSSHFPVAVKSIVGLFVWGIIGLWVLKDIRSITNKIAEGSPENVGSDVKKEVL